MPRGMQISKIGGSSVARQSLRPGQPFFTNCLILGGTGVPLRASCPHWPQVRKHVKIAIPPMGGRESNAIVNLLPNVAGTDKPCTSRKLGHLSRRVTLPGPWPRETFMQANSQHSFQSLANTTSPSVWRIMATEEKRPPHGPMTSTAEVMVGNISWRYAEHSTML